MISNQLITTKLRWSLHLHAVYRCIRVHCLYGAIISSVCNNAKLCAKANGQTAGKSSHQLIITYYPGVPDHAGIFCFGNFYTFNIHHSFAKMLIHSDDHLLAEDKKDVLISGVKVLPDILFCIKYLLLCICVYILKSLEY